MIISVCQVVWVLFFRCRWYISEANSSTVSTVTINPCSRRLWGGWVGFGWVQGIQEHQPVAQGRHWAVSGPASRKETGYDEEWGWEMVEGQILNVELQDCWCNIKKMVVCSELSIETLLLCIGSCWSYGFVLRLNWILLTLLNRPDIIKAVNRFIKWVFKLYEMKGTRTNNTRVS